MTPALVILGALTIGGALMIAYLHGLLNGQKMGYHEAQMDLARELREQLVTDAHQDLREAAPWN